MEANVSLVEHQVHFAFLVELLVSFVDVTDVSVVHVRSPPTVLGPLTDLTLYVRCHLV